jgi:transcriptional regulator with XRE-family HTH domain
LIALDIGALYRMIQKDAGISQRQIAACTGQSQSEVADIIAGRRKVENNSLLRRIADGLGIPAELMGLSWWSADGTYARTNSAYCEEVTVAELPEGVSAEMLRRHVLALGVAAAFGAPIRGLGELLDVDTPKPAPLPSRLSGVHVVQVRRLAGSLRETIHAHGSQPQVSSAVTTWADRLLDVSGAESVKQALMAAVAELHTVAGWAGLDAGLHDRALYHYSRALELATETRDAFLQTVALACAGLTMLEHGHPDDGLKMLQLGQIRSWDIAPDHGMRKIVEASALADASTALAFVGQPQAADIALAKSRELWQPAGTEPWGDPDGAAARLEIERGRFDRAEPFAVASIRRWEGISQLRRTRSVVVLATVHVQTGEPNGLEMAHRAITDVTRLSSVQARSWLRPLAAALESRPSGDAKELARVTRRMAAMRV